MKKSILLLFAALSLSATSNAQTCPHTGSAQVGVWDAQPVTQMTWALNKYQPNFQTTIHAIPDGAAPGGTVKIVFSQISTCDTNNICNLYCSFAGSCALGTRDFGGSYSGLWGGGFNFRGCGYVIGFEYRTGAGVWYSKQKYVPYTFEIGKDTSAVAQYWDSKYNPNCVGCDMTPECRSYCSGTSAVPPPTTVAPSTTTTTSTPVKKKGSGK